MKNTKVPAVSPPIEFDLEGSEFIELKNLLKVSGLCATGGIGKQAIEQGEVHVDGKLELRKSYKVKPGQMITYNKNTIKVLA